MQFRLGLLGILVLAFLASAADYRYESRTISDALPTPAALPRGEYEVARITDLADLKLRGAPLFVGNWEHAPESSAIFRIGWNDSGMLIHAEVFDDAVSPANENQPMWRADSVEIYLDLRDADRRTEAYHYDDARQAGQLGLAPPSKDVTEQDAPRLARGSGSLDANFNPEVQPRGYRKTDTGYEMWLTVPTGAWLKNGAEILADFGLNDRGEAVGGHYFAFGEDFNWKSNSRFGRLRFVDRPGLPAQMDVTSSMGVSGQAGSNQLYEDIRCYVYSMHDPAGMKFEAVPSDSLSGVTSQVSWRQMGEHRLYRLHWTGRNTGGQPATFTVTGQKQQVSRQWPATLAEYEALLKRIAEERTQAPAEHPCQVLYDIAREDVLCSMVWRKMTGPELVRAVKQGLAIARDMRAGIVHPRMTLGSYYSQGQQRWLPFVVFTGETKADGTMGAEVYLHGSSGFDFTRGSFVRQKLEDADRLEQERAPLPKRAMIFFYGAGNDYPILGQDDWKYVPPILARTMKIDPKDVHLRGHSMGGGATFSMGARIAGLSPSMPFRTFTPAAASIRNLGDAADGNAFEQFRHQRQSLQSLFVNYQKRPFLLVHGIHDQSVPLSSSRNAMQWLKGKDIPVDILEIPAQGHGPRGFEEIRDIWLSRQKPAPIAAWLAYELRYAEANGVRADCFEVWGRPAWIRFPAAQEIETENIAALDLSQWQGDWPVKVNGQLIAKDHPKWIVNDSFKAINEQVTTVKTRWNCGPISEVGRRGFVIVTGTAVPERRKLLHDLSQKIRDSILGTEWGLKEDDLKIHQDTDANIPTDTCVIVVGTPEENIYAARRADPVQAISHSILPDDATARAGIILLRPDRHLLVQGDADFYAALMARASRSLLPLDYDYQVWTGGNPGPQPRAEGEFDEQWKFSTQWVRFK